MTNFLLLITTDNGIHSAYSSCPTKNHLINRCVMHMVDALVDNKQFSIVREYLDINHINEPPHDHYDPGDIIVDNGKSIDFLHWITDHADNVHQINVNNFITFRIEMPDTGYRFMEFFMSIYEL